MGQKPADIPLDLLQKLYFEERLSQTQVAQRLGCSLGAIQRRMQKHGITARSKSEAELAKTGTIRLDFDGDDYTKAYMMGFCKGDVCAWIRGENDQTIRLYSATTKPEQIELFRSLFVRYGRFYLSNPDRRGALHMAAYVNLSFSFLLDEKDSIPDWILADQSTFLAFFAGYADAEAHIGVHNGYAVFKLDSYDKNIIHQSHKILREVGVIGPYPFICTYKGQRTKQGHHYRHDMWRLQVSSKSSLLLLFEKIRPFLKHGKRIRDMEAAIQNIEERNTRPRRRIKEQTA